MVGGIGTGGHYVTLLVLVELLHINTTIATSAGFIIGAVINYILNYHITFKSQQAHRETLFKFMIIAAIGGVFNSFIMYLGASVFLYPYFLVQLVATAIVLLWNFTINKIWVFAVSA